MNIDEIIKKADEIEGWFSEYEMRLLYPHIQALKPGSLLVELGTYYGKSTRFFRLANKDIRIITIDVCKQYPVQVKIPEAIDPRVLAEGNILQIAGDSHEIVKGFNLDIDFLFIDTRHTYEDTIQNLVEWGKYAKKYIACHDYHEGFKGVQQAVDEYLQNNKKLSLVDLKGIGIALIKVA